MCQEISCLLEDLISIKQTLYKHVPANHAKMGTIKVFHAKMGTIKDRNDRHLTGTEILRRGGKNTQKN